MNQLFYGDNLPILRQRIKDESVDLIYLDPPFNSNRSYNVLFQSRSGDDPSAQIEAFDDTWTWSQDSEELFTEMVGGGAPAKVADALLAMRKLIGDNDLLAYLVMMAARLVELRRVLRSTGSLYLHCDPTASHYLKLVLDAIFGPTNLINEIIWKRTAVKGDARVRFGRNHDTLLAYSGGGSYVFHAQTTPHTPEYKARFRFDDGDGRGPYRDGPLDSPNPRPNLTYEYKGYPPPANGWRVSLEEMQRLDADNRLIFPKQADARIARKLYLSERDGVPMGDTWTDISPLNSQAAERLGYPTQKPLALLERILEASSDEGDVVLDPFCGCGTAVDAAQKLNRQWIGIDITYLAIDLIDKRLQASHGPEVRQTYEISGVPHEVAAAQALFDKNPFDFERWAVSLVNGQPNEKQVGDKGSDGVIRFWLNKTDVGSAIVSVKGGKSLNPSMVQALDGAMTQAGADMGVFICLGKPTKGMIEFANKSGIFTYELSGATYPRIQIITIAGLLTGKRPKMPTPINPYKKAKRASGQMAMFEE